MARYKFTLAFENSISADYVTEKFFDALIAGSVPVYRGAPNVGKFAPAQHCYIDVSLFPGPRELAEYLRHLDKSPAEYAAYLEWKTRPLDPKFVTMARRFAGSPLRRLAAKLSLRNGILESAHVQCDPIHKAIRWLNSRAPRAGRAVIASPNNSVEFHEPSSFPRFAAAHRKAD
jgi:Glycosyltransferase family 10 (fucosyltransferase) C-term